jgi:cysteine desulfurase
MTGHAALGDDVDRLIPVSNIPRIYFDWNASAPLHPQVRVALLDAVDALANPSSLHGEGRRARDLVEAARGRVSALVGRPREQVIFTSGGTEANALGVAALAAAAERRALPRVVATTAIEHPSLRGAVAALARQGWQVRELAPAARYDVAGVGLVAFAAVNHELGTCHTAGDVGGALVHVDAVQAAGKLELAGMRADALAISAHKLGGPQGAGALALAADAGLSAIDAGHQERGRRAGTENVLGIVGLGAAAAAVVVADWPRVASLGEQLERSVLAAVPDTRVHGAELPRIGGTHNLGFTGARGQDVVIALDLAGIAAATGAACTSGSVQPSAVLMGMGLPAARALEAVRFSLGRTSTRDEIDRALAVLPELVARARRHA